MSKDGFDYVSTVRRGRWYVILDENGNPIAQFKRKKKADESYFDLVTIPQEPVAPPIWERERTPKGYIVNRVGRFARKPSKAKFVEAGKKHRFAKEY